MRLSYFRLFLLSAGLAMTAPVVYAQEKSSAQPIEITAQKALEWNREQKQYIARQDAKAVQGDLSVAADTLTADYRDGPDGATEIYRLTAEGNVSILSGTSTASGERAVYDVNAGKAVVTGTQPKLQGENLSVMANERIEYYAHEGRLVAVGRPFVTSGTDTLEADSLTAWIDTSKESEGAKSGDLRKAEAVGNVIIVTSGETATADKAIYDTALNQAQLIGHARVKRENNVMEGERAEMNLTTKVSRMLGSGSEKGRVKGVFYPAK